MRVMLMRGREMLHKCEAEEVVMPGLDGEFSVLDFHQAFLYRLRPGVVKVRVKGQGSGVQEEEIFPITDGIAKFSENSLLIFCEA